MDSVQKAETVMKKLMDCFFFSWTQWLTFGLVGGSNSVAAPAVPCENMLS